MKGIPLPKEFALYQNYPNPFNPITVIQYDVPTTSQVRLTVNNLLGQEMARLVDGRQVAGTHRVSWNATNLPSGVYLCRMQTKGFMQTRKMLLVK
ncbi:MAG: T9SS type A sorting domain-containing protein [Calditrichaeota bacterium]|nr:T9SS type A sorting domain-containing protein [Calditrichota bacterium]